MKKIALSVVLLTTILALNFSNLAGAQRTENGISTPQAPTGDHKAYLPVMFKPVPQPSQSGATIADHTVIVRFGVIPTKSLTAAAALKTLFMHQSTGNNIKTLGLNCLAGLNNDPAIYPQECIIFSEIPNNPYGYGNWDWPEWPNPMADAIAKTDQWVSIVNSRQQNYQVLGMKFCYVDGWNQNFDYYRQKMEALERTYPYKTFVWATSALWSIDDVNKDPNLEVSAANIQSFNQQLRAYAIAHNKILYDLADIESHDPNGNPCQTHGYEALCNEYYDGYGSGGGGHPDVDGSMRLAKGFWWLMARISGWDGG